MTKSDEDFQISPTMLKYASLCARNHTTSPPRLGATKNRRGLAREHDFTREIRLRRFLRPSPRLDPTQCTGRNIFAINGCWIRTPPDRIGYDSKRKPHTHTTVSFSSARFAQHHGVEGGVSIAHVLNEDGEPSLKTISFIDTNEVVPKDRYTKGCTLALTDEPYSY
jgi:hypothetical protein